MSFSKLYNKSQDFHLPNGQAYVNLVIPSLLMCWLGVCTIWGGGRDRVEPLEPPTLFFCNLQVW